MSQIQFLIGNIIQLFRYRHLLAYPEARWLMITRDTVISERRVALLLTPEGIQACRVR
ncbi:hypothetical protein M434DRAFT_251354 [Hypoxylon sp. CO27-5]|nr:hypothetical protein M434DRAFT_251354 [Hypoxylon sp. CO27-5]